MLPNPEESPTITVEEMADALGIGRTGAYDAVRRGDLPSIRIGRRIVVPVAELRRLVGLDDAVRPTAPSMVSAR